MVRRIKHMNKYIEPNDIIQINFCLGDLYLNTNTSKTTNNLTNEEK